MSIQDLESSILDTSGILEVDEDYQSDMVEKSDLEQNNENNIFENNGGNIDSGDCLSDADKVQASTNVQETTIDTLSEPDATIQLIDSGTKEVSELPRREAMVISAPVLLTNNQNYFTIDTNFKGIVSPLEIGKLLKNAKVNGTSVSIIVASAPNSEIEFNQSPDPQDQKLSARTSLFKRVMLKDEVIDVFYGYEQYSALYSPYYNSGIICYSVICMEIDEPIEDYSATNYVLVAIWKTRCVKPRMDGILYCFLDDCCYRVENLLNYMKDKFTNPSLKFDLETVLT